MPELQQITYLREKRPPTLKQFLVRKAIALAASQAKGQTGIEIGPGGIPIPRSAVLIKEALPDLKDTDALATAHPEWVQEWEEKHGQ